MHWQLLDFIHFKKANFLKIKAYSSICFVSENKRLDLTQIPAQFKNIMDIMDKPPRMIIYSGISLE